LHPSFSLSPESFIGWYDKIKESFTDFKPETRTMTINYTKGTSTIGLKITAPEGFRKNRNKLKIPAFPGFRISRMSDDVFHELKYLWKEVDGYFILDANQLPSSENYLIELEGSVESKALKNLVHIKPATNRDNDDENDKYWLDSSIKQPQLLDKIWDELEIDEVNIGVFVDINKMFGLAFPEEIKDKKAAIDDLLNTAKNFDRNTLFKAALEYKRQERRSRFHPADFYRLISRLTARDVFLKHLDVDKPYDIGDIDKPENFIGIIPQNIKVQAITHLTLRQPTALGYLKFKRKLYEEKIKDEVNRLL